MIRNILASATLSFALGAGVMGCGDGNPSGPANPSGLPLPTLPAPSGMVVSNAGSSSVAYVSAVPGTFKTSTSAAVHNKTRADAPRSFQLTGGGFDPIDVPAQAGDELSITVSTDGVVRMSIVTGVPARRTPAIVRTQPAKSGVDVGLNADLLVVFSEPVDRPSATTSAVALLQSANAVDGTVHLSADGLTARFIPSAPLALQTAYALAINQQIRDRDGDALEAVSIVPFTTTPALPVGELVFTQLFSRQIYRVKSDGTGLVQMTGSGENSNAAWSPDGRRIAFSRHVPGSGNNGGGTADIYLMDADGSNHIRRTTGFQFRSSAWSPDGRKLAVSDEGVYYAQIYLVSADDDGSPPTLLANDARTPAWSPDGKQIAYVKTSGDDGYHQVIVINSDGTSPRPLTEIDRGGIYGLSWSPNGQRIAYSKCLDGACELYVMDAEAGGGGPITNDGRVQEAAWSPDGKWIAVTVTNYSGSEWQPSVAYIPAEGGSPRVIVSGGFNPSWRP